MSLTRKILKATTVVASVGGATYFGMPGSIGSVINEALEKIPLPQLSKAPTLADFVTTNPYVGAGLGMVVAGLSASSRLVPRLFSKGMTYTLLAGTAFGLLDRGYMWYSHLGHYTPLNEFGSLVQFSRDVVAVGVNVTFAAAVAYGINKLFNRNPIPPTPTPTPPGPAPVVPLPPGPTP